MIYKIALGASDSNGETSTILPLEARSGEGGVGDAGLGLGRGSSSGLGRGQRLCDEHRVTGFDSAISVTQLDPPVFRKNSSSNYIISSILPAQAAPACHVGGAP